MEKYMSIINIYPSDCIYGSETSSATPLVTKFVDLTDAEKKAWYESSNLSFEARMSRRPNALVGVAEGDSWFDYPPAFIESFSEGDLLAQLHKTGRYNIWNVAKAGDTLENMAYGTDVQSNDQPKPAEILGTVDAVKRHQPKFFLLSAGGNDMSGSNGVCLENYLNHAATELPPLRQQRALDTFANINKAALSYIINQVKAAKADIHIFIQGYDYAVPDGRPVFSAPFGFHFIGPWLLPAFARKRIWPPSARQEVINALVDMYNQTIADLAASDPQVHHIDCRGVLRNDPQSYQKDWANELHPTPNGWGKIATRFDQVISRVLARPGRAAKSKSSVKKSRPS
jgi:hypothetical protein